MAQPPTKSMTSSVPVFKPNPLHGPPSVPETQPVLERVNIHGIPPKPNMAPLLMVDEDEMNDYTRAEMEAGKAALDVYSKRAQAEHEYGAKIVARVNRVINSQSKEE